VWEQSRPVLHLLLAFNGSSNLLDAITCPDWLPAALKHAEQYRTLITWSHSYAGYTCPYRYPFPIAEAETIQLLPL